MKAANQERSSKPEDDSSGMSSLHRRFLANAEQLQVQDAEIQRLQRQTQEQQQRIDELEAQVLQPNKSSDEEHDNQLARLRSELADRDRLLQEQDDDMDQATQTITMLMQQVQALQQVAARAEQAQRDAEADQMLRHVLREDGDDDEVDAEIVRQLRAELQSAVQARQQSSRLVCELEEERVWLKETAEVLSSELQVLKEANRDMLVKMESEQKGFREMEMAKAKADKEINHLKAVESVREEMLTVMQAQVKTMQADNQKLKHAITCCQQSADRQFQVLEKDRQSIDEENYQLRLELSSLKEDFTHLSNKLRDIQNEELDVASDCEEGLEVLQTDEYASQVHGAATPVVKLERALAASPSHTMLGLAQVDFQKQGTNSSLYELWSCSLLVGKRRLNSFVALL